MQLAITYLAAILGVICILALLRQLRSTWALEPDLRNQIWVATIIAVGGVAANTGFVGSSQAFQIAWALVVLMLVIARNLRYSQVNTSANLAAVAVMVALWGWLFISNVIHNIDSSTVVLLSRLVPGAVLIVVALTWRTSPLSRQAFAAAGIFVLSLMCIVAPLAVSPWRPCDQFKCGIFDGMMRGPFSSENYLAYQAMFAGLLAVVTLRGFARVSAVVLTLLVLLATESRTSQLAFVFGVAIYLVVRALRPKVATPHLSPGLAAARTLFPIAFPALAVWLIITADPTTFSNRGNVWIKGFRALQEDPVFGLGLERWNIYQAAGLVPDHYPHNEYLIILFSGGFVGLSIFVGWIAVLLRFRNGNLTQWAATLALVSSTLIIGLTEVTWNPLALDGLFWTALAICAVPVMVHRPQSDVDGPARDVSLNPAQQNRKLPTRASSLRSG